MKMTRITIIGQTTMMGLIMRRTIEITPNPINGF